MAPSTPVPLVSAAQDQSSVNASSPSLTHPSVTSPILSSAASVSQHPEGSMYSAEDSPVLSEDALAKLPSPQKVIPSQTGGVDILDLIDPDSIFY